MSTGSSTGTLILVSAPSGAGKTSLVAAALEADSNLVVSVSYTTRSRRDGEQDGVNYHFVDNPSFQAMIQDGAFLEYAQVFGHYYGTAMASVDALRSAGRDVILEIDWQGAAQVRKQRPDALSIFIMPPSEEHLEQRLRDRGKDSAASIETRLAEARLDMSKADQFQYIVVNDQFSSALADILAIVQARRLQSAQQLAANPVVKKLVQADTD
ncbi:MAG: guanylate kinase [Pseudomonadota bacterium]